jgi:threonine dehydrogenase-like Zn-dependent dehydrogenase
VVAECSGSADALAAGMSAAAKGGRLLLVGDYKKAQAQFPWNRMIHGELRLIGSNASAGAWPEAVKLVVRREIPLERLVTHRLPARRFSEAMELARSCREAIKVVLCWDAATVDS